MRNIAFLSNGFQLASRARLLARSRRRLRLAAGMVVFVAVLIMSSPGIPAPEAPYAGASLSPDQPLVISVPPFGLTTVNATLQELSSDDALSGAPSAAPVDLLADGKQAPGVATRMQLVHQDGAPLLRPDASYSLTLSGDWNPIALLWLRFGHWSAVYHFSTKPSPRPVLPDAPLRPRYGQPIAIEWNIPVASFAFRVSPAVDSSYALDPTDPRRAQINLQSYVPGQTYVVEVVAATAANGVSLQRPYSFSVVMPKSPEPYLISPTTLRIGEAVVLGWDEPIVDFDYRIDPTVESSAAVDPSDRRRASIALRDVHQGQRYLLTVSNATGENGLYLQQPYTFTLTVPPALAVAETTPGDGAFGVDPNQAISISFSEAVADQAVAERAVAISPALLGRYEWKSERELAFVPASPFPFESEVSVRIAGGPDGVRGKSGSYLEEDISFSFTIRPNKVIDVDLKRQVVTLLEGGQVVLTSLTSTGVRGAETPVGTFMVQYKMASARMRGVTPSGNRYDLPNVPWVLPFWGDYTIHGAYWRRGFGFPQSNGCVSLPVPIAKQVFDWAPVGTPVVIHY